MLFHELLVNAFCNEASVNTEMFLKLVACTYVYYEHVMNSE